MPGSIRACHRVLVAVQHLDVAAEVGVAVKALVALLAHELALLVVPPQVVLQVARRSEPFGAYFTLMSLDSEVGFHVNHPVLLELEAAATDVVPVV